MIYVGKSRQLKRKLPTKSMAQPLQLTTNSVPAHLNPYVPPLPKTLWEAGQNRGNSQLFLLISIRNWCAEKFGLRGFAFAFCGSFWLSCGWTNVDMARNWSGWIWDLDLDLDVNVNVPRVLAVHETWLWCELLLPWFNVIKKFPSS